MPLAPRRLLLATLLLPAFAGCSQVGSQARLPASRAVAADPFARSEERQAYVDDHYRQVLKSGRAGNEEQARAVAALEWESRERHRTDAPAQTWSWSSDDARKQAQDKFAADLEKLP